MENEEIMQESPLLHYRDKQYRLNERLSKKMQIILDAQPENTYQGEEIKYFWDEGGLSELFAECYFDENRYCPEKQSWYSYDGTRWVCDIGAHIVSDHILEFVRLLDMYTGEITNEEHRAAYKKFLLKTGNRKYRENILRDASDKETLTITLSQFDADPYLINCRNGTFDLRKQEFREHSWQDFLTMRTNFDFGLRFMDMKCERWEQFINEITIGDKDKAEYLQKALGYSMLGIANEECMFI